MKCHICSFTIRDGVCLCPTDTELDEYYKEEHPGRCCPRCGEDWSDHKNNKCPVASKTSQPHPGART